MPKNLESEYELAAKLAVLRYGPTGACCPKCGHKHAYHLKSRARMLQCKLCRAQWSVTSGTVMQYSKLSLRVWFAVADQQARGHLPTSGDMAREHAIKRSSAWHVLHRVMRPLSRRSSIGQAVGLEVKCRRPKAGSPPMKPDTPEKVLALRKQFKLNCLRCVTPVTLRLQGPHAALDAVAARPDKPAPEHLVAWIRYQLEGIRKTVSLRWLARWLGHLLHLKAAEPPSNPLSCLLVGGPMPLHALRP